MRKWSTAAAAITIFGLAWPSPSTANNTQDASFEGIIGTCVNMVLQENGDEAPDLFDRCGEVLGNYLQTDGDTDPALIIGRDEIGVAGRSATEASVNQRAALLQRMAAVRAGASGVSIANVRFEGEELPTEGLLAEHRGTPVGGSGASGDAGSSRWGLFVNGGWAAGDRDLGGEDVGFDFDSYGLTIGADYRFRPDFFAGLAFTYSETDNELTGGGGVAGNGSGALDMESQGLSFYFSSQITEAWFFDGTLAFGQHDIDTATNVQYDIGDPVSQIALGSTDGDSLLGGLSLGNNFNRGAFNLASVLRGTYSKLEIDGYVETMSNGNGTGGELPLVVLDQEIESLTSHLEFDFSYTKSTSWGVFLPQGRIGWVHEFEDDPRSVRTGFADDPNFGNRSQDIPDDFPVFGGDTISKDLIVFTDDPDRDFYTLGLGFNTVFAGGHQWFLFWDTILGRGDLTMNAISTGIRFAL